MPISLPSKIPPKKILVVEDEPPVADTIKMVLTMGGHSVEIAEDARQALRMLDAGQYDLVITDYALGSMTGLDVAKSVKGRSPAPPVIMITAYAESLAMRKERLANVDFLLGKPFSLEQMQEALVSVFRAA